MWTKVPFGDYIKETLIDFKRSKKASTMIESYKLERSKTPEETSESQLSPG